VLITFVLSGYYDSELKRTVAAAVSSARPLATTGVISARQSLPDAYYSLVHEGRLNWDVTAGMVTLSGSPQALRNLAVMLPLAPNGPELGRGYCGYRVRIDVAAGAVSVKTALPQFTMTPNALTLACAFTGAASTDVTWDFGDGSEPSAGAAVQHAYARPGRYEVLTRLVNDQNLIEYRSAVVVSTNHQTVAPLVVAPSFSAGAAGTDGLIPVTVSVPPGVDNVSIDCAAGSIRARADSGSVTLNLAPGSYAIDVLVTRKLSVRFYSRQRYLPTEPVDLRRGRAATNRTFDLATGAETTASPNAFTTRLFAGGSAVLSPVDRWTLEIPVADNPWCLSVTPADVVEFDGAEYSDAILSVEFVSA
jgi:PKD repeat protein